MFIAYSSADICKVDKGWIPDLSPTYYGDNKWGYPKWGLKRKKYRSIKLVFFCLQIHFLMCISANITHLRDARFATLNAYEEAEDAQNAKQLNDTTM